MEKNRVRIKIKSYDHRTLDQSVKKIVEVVKRVGVKMSGPIPLPVERKLYTVNRSPHIDKKSREQFEIRIHKRLIDLIDPNDEVIAALQSLELPSGVNVEVKY